MAAVSAIDPVIRRKSKLHACNVASNWTTGRLSSPLVHSSKETSSAPARGIDPFDQLVDEEAGRKRHEATRRAKADLGAKGTRVSQRQGDSRGVHEL